MSHTGRELSAVRLADALPGAKVWGTRRYTLEALLRAKPEADLLDARLAGGVGPATIRILLKAAGIARAQAHGKAIGLCPCSFTEENVGTELAALVFDDCGPHIEGCAYVAEHGEDGSAEEVGP